MLPRQLMRRSYGGLGGNILLRHFTNLVKWGYLPITHPGVPDRPYHPLTSAEYLIHALVPEASTRLIMEDKGWDEEQPIECPAWQAAWKEASDIRHASS